MSAEGSYLPTSAGAGEFAVLPPKAPAPLYCRPLGVRTPIREWDEATREDAWQGGGKPNIEFAFGRRAAEAWKADTRV